ncbi:DUF4401 domain-containing protein [Flagellimonas pacifica]|uniref:DUF4401 domain-containing protein n=1 Tax=Flagellimonas pacifica TaxID=1247520 RepID=A0A285MCR5_9FLAO|nr:DUF4401 domain-containing protein [Allomuricauda parva]SNY94974.1 protein of unknown function [Allomuricauda parva]
MDKVTSIKSILETIRADETSRFECDENALMQEYLNKSKEKSSLAIKVLSIFGGFLASLAFISFLFILGLYDSAPGLLIFGIGLIVAAILLNKKYDKLIVDTVSISAYIIGFILLILALAQYNVGENGIAALIIVIAICCMVIVQRYMLSFISLLAINASFLFMIISNDLYDFIHIYIAINTFLLAYWFINEAEIITSGIKLSKLYDPVRIALLFSLLFGFVAIGKRDLMPLSFGYVWLSSLTIFSAIIYLVHYISGIVGVSSMKNKVVLYTLSAFILLPTVFAPAISGAILIILLSFMTNYKTGLVIGIISLIYFVSQYYYDLNLTLLTKSIILMVSGVIFILFYLFTSKKLRVYEKD